MYPQLAVFDMNGTVIADADAVPRCLGGALEAAGISVASGALSALMSISKSDAIRLLIERTPRAASERGDEDYDNDPLITRIHADFFARMLAYYHSDPDVHEVAGATATFRDLQEDGIKIALDTGFSRPVADAIMERFGWARAGLVDATVSSDEVAFGRPAPDMIQRAMVLTRVTEPGLVARVGSSPMDLRPGAAAGCRWVIGITGTDHRHTAMDDTYHTHLVPTIAAVPAFLRMPI